MRQHFPWGRWILAACCSIGLSWTNALPGFATDLPPGVLNYLRQKDPSVKVRFDGFISFSNGENYVPVIPQDPALNPDPQQVIMTIPENQNFPDFIEFDNHFFLMRLIRTTSGRLTFPKLNDYPIQLKEGLLPQDFVLPTHLFIPVELKIILGALPYNPNYTATAEPLPATQKPPVKPQANTTKPTAAKPATASTPKPASKTGANTSKTSTVYSAPAKPQTGPAVVIDKKPTPTITPAPMISYVFDLSEQKLLAIDLADNKRQTEVPLNCVPASLKISPDGKLLFAPCLSTNETVIIDTGANLVKTRVPVGKRPDTVLYLDKQQQVIISNRHSAFLSTIHANELLPGDKIDLPGNGGAMAKFPGESPTLIAVADAFKPHIYLINLNTRTVEKTITAISDISALKVLSDSAGNYEIWAASRSNNKVIALDASTGAILKTLTVGQKPVEFASYGEKLYVLCAGDAQLDVIHWPQKRALKPISLSPDSFPSGIMALGASKKAYITTARSNGLIVFNLENALVEATHPTAFRASLIAMTPDAPSGKSEPIVPSESRVHTPEMQSTQARSASPDKSTAFNKKPAPPITADKGKSDKAQTATSPPKKPLANDTIEAEAVHLEPIGTKEAGQNPLEKALSPANHATKEVDSTPNREKPLNTAPLKASAPEKAATNPDKAANPKKPANKENAEKKREEDKTRIPVKTKKSAFPVAFPQDNKPTAQSSSEKPDTTPDKTTATQEKAPASTLTKDVAPTSKDTGKAVKDAPKKAEPSTAVAPAPQKALPENKTSGSTPSDASGPAFSDNASDKTPSKPDKKAATSPAEAALPAEPEKPTAPKNKKKNPRTSPSPASTSRSSRSGKTVPNTSEPATPKTPEKAEDKTSAPAATKPPGGVAMPLPLEATPEAPASAHPPDTHAGHSHSEPSDNHSDHDHSSSDTPLAMPLPLDNSSPQTVYTAPSKSKNASAEPPPAPQAPASPKTPSKHERSAYVLNEELPPMLDEAISK